MRQLAAAMQRALLHAEAAHAHMAGMHAHAGPVAATPAAAAAKPMRHGTLEGHVLPGVMFVVWGACALFRPHDTSTHGWLGSELAAVGRSARGAAFHAARVSAHRRVVDDALRVATRAERRQCPTARGLISQPCMVSSASVGAGVFCALRARVQGAAATCRRMRRDCAVEPAVRGGWHVEPRANPRVRPLRRSFALLQRTGVGAVRATQRTAVFWWCTARAQRGCSPNESRCPARHQHLPWCPAARSLRFATCSA